MNLNNLEEILLKEIMKRFCDWGLAQIQIVGDKFYYWLYESLILYAFIASLGQLFLYITRDSKSRFNIQWVNNYQQASFLMRRK